MLASFDPVALDQACADLCNQMTPVKESVLGENLEKLGRQDGNNSASHDGSRHADGKDLTESVRHDHFHMTHPDTEWESCISHAVKIGLGTDRYELIKIG